MVIKNKQLDEAFCSILNRVVTIDEVIEAYSEELIPARTCFQCPDENCRETHNAEITCVCCYSDKCGRPKHFRHYPHTKHSETCIYGTWSKAVDYLLDTKHSYGNPAAINLLFSYTGGIEPTHIHDEYDPDAGVGYMDQIRGITAQNINLGMENNDAICQAIIRTHRQTRRFEAIVSAYELLKTEENRKIAQLKIPGRQKASFQRVFRPVKNMRSDFQTPYIIFGKARVYRYDQYNGFRIFFSDKVFNYTPEDQYVSATCFIADNDLEQYRFGKQLRAELEKYAVSKKTCTVYLIANHSRQLLSIGNKPSNPYMVLTLDSLGEIVLRDL